MTGNPHAEGRLPDKAFGDPLRADPTQDRHEAFPVVESPRSVGSLPPTAWATPVRSMPALAHHVPSTHRSDRRLATFVVGLLTLVPVGLGVASLISSSGGSEGPEVVYGQGAESVWRSLDASQVAPLQPDGAAQHESLHELPAGVRRIRVEVVAAGGGATTSLHLLAPEGNTMRVDLPLPAVFEVTTSGSDDGVGIVVAPNDERVEVQCRVYADDRLVAISTGRGLVECVARPPG